MLQRFPHMARWSFILFLSGYFMLGQVRISLAQSERSWADSVYAAMLTDFSGKSKIIKQYGDTLHRVFHARGEHDKEIKTDLYICSYLNEIGDFKKSLRTNYLAMQEYKKYPYDSIPLLAEIYLSYARLYASMLENKRKAYYVEKGIQSWKPYYNDNRALIRLYSLKADSYEDLSKKLYFHRQAYDMALKEGDSVFMEHCLTNIGTSYAIEGDFPKASFYLKQSLALALRRGAFNTLSSLYNNLAGLSSNDELTRMYVDSAIYFAKASGNMEDELTGLQNKALIYYNKEQYKEGYNLLWESILLRDTLYNSQKLSAFAEMEQRFESERKNIEINVLQRENEITNLKASRRLGLSMGLGGALIGILIMAFVFYRQNKKKQRLNKLLSREKKKSDDLLLNILPHEVAEELKANGQSVAKLYNKVSVLFTDFVNFTGISEEMSPTELVQEIHENFTAFDAIMEKHGVEKIKTIGDAYLAVCGLPNEHPDHAERIIAAAKDIREYMASKEGKFQIRMGVHSGAVVAGIVGVKKYAYDIWGDTVNTAARMEQHSEAGKINISGATYSLIKDHVACTYRGKVQAKNKGEIDMYFVN